MSNDVTIEQRTFTEAGSSSEIMGSPSPLAVLSGIADKFTLAMEAIGNKGD